MIQGDTFCDLLFTIVRHLAYFPTQQPLLCNRKAGNKTFTWEPTVKKRFARFPHSRPQSRLALLTVGD